ncbi:MAG: hypothetical protein Q8P78_01175 [bacterium]|nr:hypothetical protein [bacterium]
MQFASRIKKHAKKIILLGVVVLVLVALIHRVTITANRLPLEISQKVRNLSARETEWQVATSAAPGDAIEHFALIRLSSDYAESIRNIHITAQTSNRDSYREDSFASRVLGVANARLFSKEGIFVPELKPGEFIDLTWQTKVAESTSFTKEEAPLISSVVTASANGFSPRISRSIASLYSTIQRTSAPLAQKPFYAPKAAAMNPRFGYEGLGTGVLIAGEDLLGVSGLAIAETGKALVWRPISNELLEASIPAGQPAGVYTIELFDEDHAPLSQMLSFEVRPSGMRAVVVAATPSLIKSGTSRYLVLQGIRLDQNLPFALRKQGSSQAYALLNAFNINERVLTAQVPADLTPGSYTILVGDIEQDVRLVVN